MPDGDITAIRQTPDGFLWVGTPKGLARFDGLRFKVFKAGETSGLTDTRISSLLTDHEGTLWIGTLDGNLVRRHADRFESMQPPALFSPHQERKQMPGSWLWSRRIHLIEDTKETPRNNRSSPLHLRADLIEDGKGALWWHVTGLGLMRLKAGQWTAFAPTNGLPVGEIHQLACDREGRVWVEADGHFTVYGAAQGLGNPHVCALFEDSQTNIWSGTAGGLFRLESERFVRVEGPPQLEGWVKALFEDRAGRLWIGTVAGLISHEKGKFAVHPLPVNRKYCDIRAIAEDAAGDLWVGTIGQGLFRLPQGQRERLRRIAEYPAPDARFLHCDPSGTLWIGSWGGGLIRMRDGRFTVFTPADGLPCEKIQSILRAPDGTMWMSSDNGIVGVTPRALDEYEPGRSPPLPCFRISPAEGLGNRCCSGSGQPVATRSADGRLWFPNYEGVAVLDPRRVTTDRTAPNVVVGSVLADGKELTPANAGEFRAPSSVRRFEFSYVAPDLATPRDLRFRHKLEGLDRDWVEAGAQRVAYYSQLPPRQYQFRVMVGGSDGRWHESGQTLSLSVVPRFWELRWVQVLASALLLAGLGGGIALNERRKLRRKLERLETQQALENERRRIARDLHDELGARLTCIALKGEMAMQGEQLSTSAKSEIGSMTRAVRQLINATEEVIWTTDPENDTLPNLASFLGDYLERSLALTGVGYRLEVTPDLPDLPVAAQSRHNLLLAVKEAINNALRHADAKIIRMQIDAKDARLNVRISDDGHGFDVGVPRPRGTGLANIKSRMELINGNADILSETGKGTAVALSMPLPGGREHESGHVLHENQCRHR